MKNKIVLLVSLLLTLGAAKGDQLTFGPFEIEIEKLASQRGCKAAIMTKKGMTLSDKSKKMGKDAFDEASEKLRPVENNEFIAKVFKDRDSIAILLVHKKANELLKQFPDPVKVDEFNGSPTALLGILRGQGFPISVQSMFSMPMRAGSDTSTVLKVENFLGDPLELLMRYFPEGYADLLWIGNIDEEGMNIYFSGVKPVES